MKPLCTRLALLLALLAPLGVAACNTVSGVGEDVEAAGDAIDDAATKNKTY